jgi:hypothetical protein
MHGFGASMLLASTAKVSWGQPSMAGAATLPLFCPSPHQRWSGDFKHAGHCATSCRSGSTLSPSFKSGNRAEEGQDPSGIMGLTQASPGSGSISVQLSTLPQDPPGSPSASNYASGVHQETTNPIQLLLPPSGRIPRPPYASGGTELSWYSSDDTELHLLAPDCGGVQQVQPGTTSKIPSASYVRTSKPNKWMAGSPVRTKETS